MQAALGAAMGEWLLGKRLGKWALAWGALFGILPGLEGFLAGFLDSARELAAERGASHSLVVIAFGSWGMAQGLARIWTFEKISKWQAGGFVAAVWALHVLVDCFSVKGAALFWPISQRRVTLSFLDSGDWFFTIPLVFAVLWLAVRPGSDRQKTRRSSGSATSLRGKYFYLAVGASAIYALAGFCFKLWVSTGFEEDLRRRAMLYERRLEAPTCSNIFFWRAVVDRGEDYWVGYRSVFEMPSTPVRWTIYPKDRAAFAGVAELRAARTLAAVTNGWWLARPHAKGAWVGDLQQPEFRTWGTKKDMVDSRLAESWVIDSKPAGDPLRASYVENTNSSEYVQRLIARIVGKHDGWEANPRLAGVKGSLPEFLAVEE